MAYHIITALYIKATFGAQRAAGYLRNLGYTSSQAVAVLARPVRVVVPYAHGGRR